MRATQQLKYAIYGMFDLAYHGGERPTPLQEVGARQGIPARYLEQIFQRLRRAGLVRSKRGPGGGYLLALPADEISLADVVCGVQGGVLTLSESDAADECPAFVWERLRDSLEQSLAAWTVADLCREAAERGIERGTAAPPMYEI